MFSVFSANISLHKNATQSTTYITTSGAEKAVDGLKSVLTYNGGQCAVSGSQLKKATWWVDLGNISSIQNITIYYRTDNKTWSKLCYWISRQYANKSYNVMLLSCINVFIVAYINRFNQSRFKHKSSVI